VKPLADLIAKDKALSAAVANPKTNVTLFAPTEAALKTLEASPESKAILSNPAALGNVLAYHVVPGARLLPRGVKDGEALETMSKGNKLTVKKVKTPEGTGIVEVMSDAPGAKPVQVRGRAGVRGRGACRGARPTGARFFGAAARQASRRHKASAVLQASPGPPLCAGHRSEPYAPPSHRPAPDPNPRSIR
jgi:hypothetical protein